jgi:hypothetical protein
MPALIIQRFHFQQHIISNGEADLLQYYRPE